VAVQDDDDADRLQQRIQAEEHRLLPEAARLLASGRLAIEGRRVRVRPPT
jgi:phosphoribosylglycinamide formyltransferase-1